MFAPSRSGAKLSAGVLGTNDSMARRGTPTRGAGANFVLQNSNWIAIAAPLLIFGAQFAYGAMTAFAALMLVLTGAVLVLAAIADRGLYDDLSRMRAPLVAGIAFLVVIAVVAWSLTPYVPGGPHPVWGYTNTAPAAGTADKSLTAIELIKLGGLACFFLVGAVVGAQDQRAELAIRMSVLAGVTVALWSFGAQVTGANGLDLRLQGPFGSANGLATVLGLMFVIALALAVRDGRPGDAIKSATRKLPLAAAALVFVVCLMMTASRGGALATAAGLAVFAVLYLFGRREPLPRSGWAIAASVVLLAIVVGVTGDQLFGRMGGLNVGDQARETMFRVHWQAFEAAPWIGNGLGTFDIVNRTMLDTGNLKDLWNIRAVHNVYLSWIELGGVFAALPMFLCIGLIILQTLRGSVRRSRMTTLLFALLGVDAVVLAHGLTDFALEIYAIAVLWSFLLGLQYALSQGSRR